ncbi:glycosyltransferase 87 family protein [Kocuria sp. M1R5S2]|uniref:glycosyltransferase 87 family protein n=1 Tax=Kocuria rhizosphaerae TaxID=3376285 RepID=UPI0037B1F0E2
MSRGGRWFLGSQGPLLVLLGLWAALAGWLLRLPCRVPGWGAEQALPVLCATDLSAGAAAGGFLTGGPGGDEPVLAGMAETALLRLAVLTGSGPGAVADLSLVVLALAWTATVVAVAGLSGRRDAFVLAPAPVVVLAGFASWDLAAVLLMVLALLLHGRGSSAPAGACLGLAASVALFPLVVLVAVLFLAARYRDVRDAVVVLGGAGLTWLLVNGPALVVDRDGWFRRAAEATERPADGSSLWDAWARVGAVPGAPQPPELLALVLGAAAVLVLTLLSRHEPDAVQVSLLLLLVLVLTGSGYGTVHALWLAPLVVLGRGGRPEFAAWQLVEVLWWATLVLPEASWPALPGASSWDAQDLLAVVRVLFLVWLLVAVVVDVLRGRGGPRLGAADPA